MEEAVLKAVEGGHNLIILGQAGTGKTTLLKRINSICLSEMKQVALTATTGLGNHRICYLTTKKKGKSKVQ